MAFFTVRIFISFFFYVFYPFLYLIADSGKGSNDMVVIIFRFRNQNIGDRCDILTEDVLEEVNGCSVLYHSLLLC